MPRTILVVEDYADLRTAIADLLSKNDWVCETVDSEHAVERLRSKHYETILIGPRLSVTGDPVLHYLAEHQPSELRHVVVMANPYTDEDAADERCRVLAKPFSSEELLAIVKARP